MLFDITGDKDKFAFCNITVPETLMRTDTLEEWNVTVNGTQLSIQERSVTFNGIHYSICFTCNTRIVTIQVISKYVVPEFSSFFILPLFMIATLLAVIVYTRKHPVLGHPR